MNDLFDRLAQLSPAKRELLVRLLRGKSGSEPIAVVGMACRLPGAPDLASYWELLQSGRTAVTEVPASRWEVDEFFAAAETPGKMTTRWGAFVDGVDQFDPSFFGITPREASRMDPQQRLLLEVAWEAMENGLVPPDRLAGDKVGVFVGIGGTDYSKIPSHYRDYFEQIDAHVGTGNALSIAANRLSYLFNLRGPSLAVDTACSSGLIATHLAIQSLRRGESDAALAGGVNLILSPETSIAFSKARMLSPDGVCRPFDAGANGYVRGEGC
ncbi:MAG: polyketide synthase, partial [Planctomycetota bacterium]